MRSICQYGQIRRRQNLRQNSGRARFNNVDVGGGSLIELGVCT